MQEKANVLTPSDDISLKKLVLDIRNWYSYVSGKWKLILITGIFFAIAGLAYALLQKFTYTATTSFVLENNGKSKMGAYSGIAAQFGVSLPGNAGGLFLDDDNIIAFMRSRTLIAKTLRTEIEMEGKKEMLISRYLDFTGIWKDWEKNRRLNKIEFHSDPSQSSILEDSVITLCYKRLLKENLSVGKPDKDLSIITVTTRATDELFAKYFTENLMENVSRFYIETQVKKSEENVNILSHQVDSVRGLLDRALSGAAMSSDANPNMNPAFQRLRVPSQKKLVDAEINKAMLEELVKNLEISKVTLRKETPLVQIIDKPVLPLEKEKLGKLKGIVLGGLMGTFLALIYVSLQLIVRNALKED